MIMDTYDPQDERNDFIEDDSALDDLEFYRGQTWTTAELQRDFEVIGFASPYCVVRRRSDGQRGTVEFTHNPRVYFSFRP